MIRLHRQSGIVFICAVAFLLQACDAPPAAAATSTPVTVTKVPLNSQVVLTFISFEEQGQTPIYNISARTPMLSGSDDPRVQTFNKTVKDLVQHEIDYFRKNVLAEMPAHPISSGSSFETHYTLIFQQVAVWSLKFDFTGYADGAAHPYHYSQTLNYDLEQGQELSLGDLFPDNTKFLNVISQYCIAQLSQRNVGFYSGFQQGADPTAKNYRNWNITPNGLMITFDEYQVAPYAAGPQIITVPYSALAALINSKGPLAMFPH